MNNHTTARVGKRIHIILQNGRRFTDKLTESKGRYYEFENEGRVMRSDIRSFSISRPKGTRKTATT